MKWRGAIKWIVLSLAVLGIGLAAARPWLIRRGVERALNNSLGGDIEIGQFESSLLRSHLSLKDLRIINPDAWPTDADWIIAEITVNYNLSTLFRQTVHLREVTLDIEQIQLTLDMDSLMSLQSAATGRRPATSPTPPRPDRSPAHESAPDAEVLDPPPAHPEPAHVHREPTVRASRDLQIDQLNFRLGRIDLINALFDEIEDEPVPIILNLEQTFYDVDDMEQVVQALTRTLLFAVPTAP